MKLLLHARRGHSQAAPIPLFLRLAQPCAVLASCVHAPVCFREAAWSLPHGLPSLVVSKGGAAIADPCCTQILHCFCIPTKLQWGLLPCLPLTCAACRYCPCYCVPVLQAGPPTLVEGQSLAARWCVVLRAPARGCLGRCRTWQT